MIGDRMRRHRRLRKSLTSHRAPRGWRPPEPLDLDGPTERIDPNAPTEPIDRTRTRALAALATAALPTASIRRRRGWRLAVGIAVVCVAVLVAVAVYATRPRAGAVASGAPHSAGAPGGSPVGFGGTGTPHAGGPSPSPSPDASPRPTVSTPAAGSTAGAPPTTPPPTPSGAVTVPPVGALATCDGPAGIAVSFTYQDTWPTGFNATITVDNTGTRPVTAWHVRFDGLTGIVSWLTGGRLHRVTEVLDGGPVGVGDRGVLQFGVNEATGQPTACHVTVTY